MFKKGGQSRGGELNTIIGKGSVFHGTIDIESSIRIDGTVKGKLNCANALIVGKTGLLEAEIKVKSATIGGKVIGSLTAAERVELESKSALLGDLKTRLLIIDEGAIFNGNCSMEEEAVKKVFDQKPEKKVEEAVEEPATQDEKGEK